MKKILWLIIPVSFLAVVWNLDTHRLGTYYKTGFVPTSNFQESINRVPNEIVLGFWDVPERVLAAKKFRKGYFLIQRDPAGTYIVGRGKNLLQDPRTVITNKSFRISSLKSKESGLGGLYTPDNFPTEELKKMGYSENEYAEWRKENEAATNQNIGINGIEGAVKYDLPKGNNTTDWSQFQDLKLPEGILNVGGYGFPLYANEKLQNGKINLLSKGYTNLINLSALPRSQWEGKNAYYFNQLYYLIKVAARGMMKDGKNGGRFGDIAAIANLDNNEGNIDYSRVTVAGAIELGKYLFRASCCGNSIDDKRWNIPMNESVITIDEESMANYQWQGGGSYELYGYINQGMQVEAGNKLNVFWYAQPVQRWQHANAVNGVQHLSKKDIEGLFDDKNNLMNSPGWKNSSWFVDANGSYSKVPYLSQTSIYESKDGKIVLDKSGRRKFRNESFQQKYFNRSTRILAYPDEQIRYALSNSKTGEQRFGKDYVDIQPDGSASVKREYARKGFEWNTNGMARPYPQYWEPETKMWVDGIYRRADGIMADLLMLSKLEKGEWDISKANVKYRLYGEHRPKTEPWTHGGNSTEAREVGESQIFYDTFMLLFSGGQALSSWDDGYYKGELPRKGVKLYDNDDYWGRYHAKLASVQTVLKPLEGSKSTDWTYIHFYYPYWGQKNSEVISSGIYYNGKLYVFFLNPTLENGEKQTLQLEAGRFKTTIELTGHEVFYKVLDVPTGLNPVDFKLDYTTIYGRKVKVNGKVTNKVDEHYEVGR